jgi:flagellar motility protein MotE (MotC chaperone)
MKGAAVRVLPMTIAATALLFAVQLGSLWSTASLVFAGPAQAAEGAPAAANNGDEVVSETQSEPVPRPAAKRDDEDSRDPLAEFTAEEIAVLYELAERRELLAQRETQLAEREALVDAAEKRMEARVQELQKLRSSIETLVRQYDEQERGELKSVVKIYESMKPKDAAAILEKLDMPVLLSIVEAMNERRISAILADMAPARAREVTAEMARKKEIDLSRVRAADKPG